LTRQRLILSDGTIVWLDEVQASTESEVSDRKVGRELATALPSLVSLCGDLKKTLKEIAPDKAAIEFGISFTLESSGLALLVTKVGAQANFKVTLEWNAATE